MNSTAIYLCQNISGAKFAFVQSDEISLFLSDYEATETQAWFDYRLCKLISLSAAMAASRFSHLRLYRECEKHVENAMTYLMNEKSFEFDAKWWTVPTHNDVYSWFLHRQNDCTRNSILMAAQAHFSHKEMMNKKTPELQEMLFSQKQLNWNDYPDGQRRGRLIVKEDYLSMADGDHPQAYRTRWVAKDAPRMNSVEGKEFMLSLIPKNE
jgi:tRNA(His) 5'-end guanylyltransferase